MNNLKIDPDFVKKIAIGIYSLALDGQMIRFRQELNELTKISAEAISAAVTLQKPEAVVKLFTKADDLKKQFDMIYSNIKNTKP